MRHWFGKYPRGGALRAPTPILFSAMSSAAPSPLVTAYTGCDETMNRTWVWVQLAVAYGLLEASLWTEGHSQRMFALATAVWIVLASVLNRRSPRELGLSAKGLRPALVAIPIATAAAAVIILVGWQSGSLHVLFGARPPVWHSIGYAIWALMQQFILNSFFFLNLEFLLGSSRRALWGATALFCIAHIPNPVLMAGTFVAALFFISMFRRYRNIYPLGVAHAVLGLSLAITVPDVWMRHMRVGISYLHFIVR